MTHLSEPEDRGLNIRRKAQDGIVGLGLLACAIAAFYGLKFLADGLKIIGGNE